MPGKRQLNQLMTFLDKGGNTKETNRSDNALRTVRAKREADDAGMYSIAESAISHSRTSILDKEYRKGVHWLETLRLRRVKILEGGYNASTHALCVLTWILMAP